MQSNKYKPKYPQKNSNNNTLADTKQLIVHIRRMLSLPPLRKDMSALYHILPSWPLFLFSFFAEQMEILRVFHDHSMFEQVNR